MQYCHLNLHNLGCIPGRGESSFITSTRYRLGGSGALSLALAQLQYGIDITVNDSNFFSNSGTRGGIIIVLFTGVNKIQVTFDNCGFERSTMTFFNDVQLPKSIEYAPYPSKRDVAVSLLNSNFTNNKVLSINNSLILFSNYYSAVNSIEEVVNINIDECIFVEYKALIGSAMVIYECKSNGLDVGMQVHQGH